jgi:coenzyme F420-reducing hydrogenase gamma subunit
MKPKVAVFDSANCEGCEVKMTNLEGRIIDLVQAVNMVSFSEVVKEHFDSNDIAFIEGSIYRPGIDESRSCVDPRRQKQVRIGPDREYNS